MEKQQLIEIGQRLRQRRPAIKHLAFQIGQRFDQRRELCALPPDVSRKSEAYGRGAEYDAGRAEHLQHSSHPFHRNVFVRREDQEPLKQLQFAEPAI